MSAIVDRARVPIACLLVGRPVQVLIDAADLTNLGPGTWWVAADRGSQYGKRKIQGVARSELLHRVILGCPPWLDVDHINGDTLDNRRSNLRMCSHAENMRNRKRNRNNTTGFKGVRRRGQRYSARIQAAGVVHRLGAFATAQEAHEAYREAAARLHGEFARFQ